MLMDPSYIFWLKQVQNYYVTYERSDYPNLQSLISAVARSKDALYRYYGYLIEGGYAEIIIDRHADSYDISMRLTTKGQTIYRALRQGIVWDLNVNCPAVEPTIARFRDLLENSRVDKHIYAQVAALKGPEFTALRNEFLLHKIKS